MPGEGDNRGTARVALPPSPVPPFQNVPIPGTATFVSSV